MYQSTERENTAREKLYAQIQELRACVLDLLNLVDQGHGAAIASVARRPADELRDRIIEIEHREQIIRRARKFMTESGDAAKYTGPQNDPPRP